MEEDDKRFAQSFEKLILMVQAKEGENAKQFLEGIEPGFYLMADDITKHHIKMRNL